MTPDQRKKLEEKKANLQLQIQLNEFIQDRINPFIEILEILIALQIKHQVVKLRCIPQKFHQPLKVFIENNPIAKHLPADITITSEDSEIEEILVQYPSANPFRYVSDSPTIGYGNLPNEILSELLEAQHLGEEKVFICWLTYAFLVEINLQELSERANTDLFNFWYSDALIFPKDNNWLISFSLEDEWRFKRE